MEREVSAMLGVVLERRPATSRWVDWVWAVPEVIADAPPTDGWREIARDGETRRYLSAPHALTLHHKMVEAYDSNIETGEPCVWALLEATDGSREPGWRVFAVTADPYEAQGFLERPDSLVERVAMPPATVAWMARFLAAIPEAPAFKKRRRTKAVEERQIFGKAPIFNSDGGPEEGGA
ncbi:DUF3305 domain-containing protein [Stappia stellulata]|uniref:DUF3305 domain-containing protein n=1 Tax=Stappia stellulata TaxID=71235 RepID=UPI00146A332D|nr:DUF3305 domain-containing protein [Stappia stellulata]